MATFGCCDIGHWTDLPSTIMVRVWDQKLMLARWYVHGEDAEAVDGELRDVEEAVGGEAAEEAARVAVLLRQLRAGQTAGRGVAVAVHHAALALPGQAQARTLQIMVIAFDTMYCISHIKVSDRIVLS